MDVEVQENQDVLKQKSCALLNLTIDVLVIFNSPTNLLNQ